MKHLVKNIWVTVFSILFIFLSIKSSYAVENYELKKITPLTSKSVELEIQNIGDTSFNGSDLEIYHYIGNTAEKENEKKIILTLSNKILKNTSYSLISLSMLEGDITFRTGDDFIGKEIQNNDLDTESQGIKSIILKSNNQIELYFNKNIEGNDIEFQLLKNIEIKKIYNNKNNNITVVLKQELIEDSDYLGTMTFLKTIEGNKIGIKKGIYYFSTKKLEKYKETKEEIKNDSLKGDLLKALNKSKKLNNGELLDGEKELLELSSAGEEDTKDIKKSQLEKLALSQNETPDTGAETWVLILGTFIINTFYFLSRRKKKIII